MAESDYVFDGDSYSAATIALLNQRNRPDGVLVGVGGELACSCSGADMNVSIAAGEMRVAGYHYVNSATLTKAQTADPTNPRINRIVVRWSSGGTITVNTLAGTPAGSPVAPSLTWSGVTKEYSLCQVLIPANAATIPAANVTDERFFSDAGGAEMVSLTNRAGVTRNLGDVVVADSANDKSFTTTTTARDQKAIGVVGDVSIASTAAGRICVQGVHLVNVDGATAKGNWLVSSATAGKATPKANRELGAFAVALTATSGAGQCYALLLGSTDGGTATATANMPAAYDGSGVLPLAAVPATLTGKDADTLDGHHWTDVTSYTGNVPVGGIILWSGSLVSIPANWHLCDGSAGTPDLRDRFVVGAGSSYAVAATGGSATLPNHAHAAGTYASAGHDHGGLTSAPDNPGTPLNNSGATVGADNSHHHTISWQAGLAVSGTSGNPSSNPTNVPPYYALAYIMRTA